LKKAGENFRIEMRKLEERLQKLLSAAGICSRRCAERYLAAGRVTVNGAVARLGGKADPARDRVAVDGKVLHTGEERIWLMLNKPQGYVSTLSDERGRRTAASLVRGCGRRVWPVGRLDMDSEGLLLFTNDGEGANRVLHPSHEVEKEYRVTVFGDAAGALEALRGPMELDGVPLAPARVSLLRRTRGGGVLGVVIHEGKNRQVRRMCALAGLTVTRLERVREGCVELGGLPGGQWRYLSPSETAGLLGPG